MQRVDDVRVCEFDWSGTFTIHVPIPYIRLNGISMLPIHDTFASSACIITLYTLDVPPFNVLHKFFRKVALFCLRRFNRVHALE